MLFEKCIKVILNHEGGYVNHSADPGGETKYGISKRQYPNINIKTLTERQAAAIYKRDYWDAMRLTSISNHLIVLHLFDMGVNAGIKTAVRLLQEILKLKTDGIIGPITRRAINDYYDKYHLVTLYKEARINYYIGITKRNPKTSVFLNGWLNRVKSTKFEV